MTGAIDDALLPGETVLWRGRPNPSPKGPAPAALRALGALGALVSGFGAGLTVYALVSALRHGDHFEWPLLLMLALVTLALFAACVRFALRPVRPNFGDDERTNYAVTTRRAIVAVEAAPPAVSALPIDAALEIDETIAADGQGTLVFRSGSRESIMFDGIVDAPSVLDIIRKIRNDS